MTAAPLPLPQWTERSAKAHNHLLSQNRTPTFSLGQTPYFLTRTEEPATTRPSLQITVHLGNHRLDFFFEDLIGLELLHLTDQAIDLASLPLVMQGAALEHLIAPLPQQLADHYGCPCRLSLDLHPTLTAAPAPLPRYPLALVRESDGRRAAGFLICDSETLVFLTARLPAPKTTHHRFATLPHRGRVLLDGPDLQPETLAGCCPGDLLLIPAAYHAKLVYAGGTTFLGRLQQAAQHTSFLVEAAMSTNPTPEVAEAHPNLLPPPVHITCHVGSVTLDWNRLSQVDHGHVLTLDGAANQAVQVCANGRPFAKGELVAVGERLGVRLLEVNHGHA